MIDLNIFKTSKTVLIQTIQGLISWIIIFYLGKNYGLSNLGSYLLIVSIVSVFQMIGNFSSEDYIISKATLLKKNSKLLLLNIIFISIIFNLLIYFLLLYLLLNNELLIFYSILGLNGIFGFNVLVENHFIGLRKVNKIFNIKFILSLIFIILLILLNKNLKLNELYILVTAYNGLISLFYILIIFKKFKIKLNYLQKYYTKYLSIFLSSFINSFRLRGSIIIVNIFLSQTNLGIYGLIVRFIEVFSLLLTALLKVFYNKIIPYFKKKQNILLLNFKFVISFFVLNLLIFLSIFIKNNDFNNTGIFLILLIIFLSINGGLLMNFVILVRLFYINKNKNYLVLYSTFYTSIMSILIMIFLTSLLDVKGSIIYLFVNGYISLFIYSILNKIYENKNK